MLRIISLKKIIIIKIKGKVVHFCTQRGTCVSVNSDLDLLSQNNNKMLHMELTVLENVVSFNIAELCCYGDRPYTEKKRKLGNTVLEALYGL